MKSKKVYCSHSGWLSLPLLHHSQRTLLRRKGPGSSSRKRISPQESKRVLFRPWDSHQIKFQ